MTRAELGRRVSIVNQFLSRVCLDARGLYVYAGGEKAARLERVDYNVFHSETCGKICDSGFFVEYTFKLADGKAVIVNTAMDFLNPASVAHGFRGYEVYDDLTPEEEDEATEITFLIWAALDRVISIQAA